MKANLLADGIVATLTSVGLSGLEIRIQHDAVTGLA
jgi:hypothetical protein